MVQELSAARHWKPSDVPASFTHPGPSTALSDSPNTPSKPLISEVSTKIISEKTDQKVQPFFTLSKAKGDDGMDDLVAEVELPSVVSYSRCNGIISSFTKISNLSKEKF